MIFVAVEIGSPIAFQEVVGPAKRDEASSDEFP